MRKKTDSLLPNTIYKVSFEMKALLQADEYTITVAIDNRSYGTNFAHEYLLRLNDVGILKIIKSDDSYNFVGIIDLNPSFSLVQI